MDATPGGEGSEGRRPHPRPSAFQKPKRLRAREADSAQNRLALGSAAADPNSLLAGNFFRRGRRSVPESLAMSWRCWLCNPPLAGRIGRGTGNFRRPEQVVIRRFRSGTGKEQVGENGARRRARPGCKARPGFPSPTGEGCPCEGPTRARRAARAKTILLSSIDSLKLHAGGPDPSRPKRWNSIGRI